MSGKELNGKVNTSKLITVMKVSISVISGKVSSDLSQIANYLKR
jgi:hypothetical protein